jgi:REP element-mobilizing transposase RayT
MNHTPRLLPRRFYHIYYRGNNRENIFIEERNYANFMRLSERFIGSIAQTYAYCLLRNHFHLLIRIKHPDEYINSAFKKSLRSNISLISSTFLPGQSIRLTGKPALYLISLSGNWYF